MTCMPYREIGKKLKRGLRVKRCKNCKWFQPIPVEYAKKYKNGEKYKNYGSCLELTMMDNVIFLRGGVEACGGYIVYKDFGCIGFEDNKLTIKPSIRDPIRKMK